MLKKTTVYLSENDLYLLRKRAAILNLTVAKTIRKSINEACKPKTHEEKKVWDALDKIWAKTASLDNEKVSQEIDKAIDEVRNEKKAKRRS